MEKGNPIVPEALARLGLTMPASRMEAGGHLQSLIAEHEVLVLHMFLWRHRAGWQMLLRSLPNGLLFIPLDSAIEVEIAAQSKTIGPGEMAVMPAGLPQAARYPAGARRRVDLIAVHLTVVDRHGQDFLRRFADCFPRIADWSFWQRRLLAATEAFNGGSDDGRAWATATIRLLLADLVLAAKRMHPPSTMDPRISACIALAQKERQRAPTVEELARRVNLSSRRFRDLFAANTGFHPKEWLLRDRLAEAARMLRANDLPVKAIAASLGFGSDHHFHTTFKRAHGCTPSGWRASGGDVAA